MKKIERHFAVIIINFEQIMRVALLPLLLLLEFGIII